MKIYRPAALSALALAALILSCENEPSGPGPYGTMGAICMGTDPNDDIHYQLLYPRGGETLYVGDTVDIRLCSEDTVFYNLIDPMKYLSFDDGRQWDVIYNDFDLELAQSKAGKPFLKPWVVPESVEVYDTLAQAARMRSILCESCRMRVTVYSNIGDPTVDYDDTDKPFRIARRSP